MEIANIIIGIIGIIVGLVIARMTMSHDRQLAKETGAFQKAEIGFSIFDCEVGEGYPDNENWLFIHPGRADDIAIYPIKFTVFNSGDAATEEILILMSVPKHIYWKTEPGEMVTLTYPSLASESIKDSVDEVGNFTLVSFAAPSLSPKSGFEIILPFSFTPTLEDFSVQIELDNHTVKQPITVLFQSIISVTIHARNITPRSFKINMGAVSALNIAEGIQKFRDLKKSPSKQGFVQGIMNLFKSVEFKVTNFASFEIENVVQHDGRHAFEMKSPTQYYRGGWLNIPSNDISELQNPETAHIIGVIDLEKVPYSQRKFRFKEGNLITS